MPVFEIVSLEIYHGLGHGVSFTSESRFLCQVRVGRFLNPPLSSVCARLCTEPAMFANLIHFCRRVQ